MILKILKTKVNQITKTIKRDDSGINGKNKRLILAVATTEGFILILRKNCQLINAFLSLDFLIINIE